MQHNRLEPTWYAIAKQDIGVAEIAGPANHPRILDYYRLSGSPGIRSEEVPWCSGAMCTWFEQAGIPSTRSLAAISWLNWGQPLAVPVLGCVAVLRRVGGNHVTLFVRWNDDGTKFLGLGANQSDAVRYSWYPLHDLRGFRWPAFNNYQQPLEPPEPEAAPEGLPRALLPKIPIISPESRLDTEDRLREDGSRTIANADSSETKAKVLAATGFAGVVQGVLATFTNINEALGPLAPLIGAGALALAALILGLYIVYEQQNIKAARVDDDRTGRHTGRK